MWNKCFQRKITNSYRIYLGFDDYDVSYSDDFGATWSTYTNTYSSPLQVLYLRGQGLPNFIGGIYWNIYYGTDLTNVSAWSDTGIIGFEIYYNPRTSYHYAVNNNGLWRSSSGASWEAVANFGYNSRSLVMNEDLWVVAGNDGVYVSTNSGTSVTNYTTSQGLGSNTVNKIIRVGSTLWAATAGGISKSTDNGANWTNYTTTNGIIHNNVTGVAYSYPRNRIYCVSNDATNGGISYTDNNGTNWSTITVSATKVLRGCQAIDDIFFVWGTGGIAYTLDGGASFTNRTTALPNTNVSCGQMFLTQTFG